MDIAIPIFKRNGFEIEDPRKKPTEEKYKRCVEEAIKNGTSLE